jgi:uncharacterized membrane protein
LDRLDRRFLYCVFIFMAMMMLQKDAQLLPYWIQLTFLAQFVLFLILVVAYCSFGMSKRAKDLKLFDRIFYIYALLAVVSVIIYSTSSNIFDLVLLSLYNPAVYFVLYIIVFLIMTIGTYFVVVRKDYKIGIALFLLVFIVILYYNTSNYIKTATNDEELVTLYATKDVLNGTDPYMMNISTEIYSSQTMNRTGYSLTTNNTIIATSDYPSLFFLSFIPFYFLSTPTFMNFVDTDLSVQVSVFSFVLIMVIWYLIDKKDILKSRYLLFGALIFLMPSLSSVASFLMLALILLAYAKIGSKYSWILLGVAASLQEELWFPILLLIAYSFNTYGLRKGMKDLVGAGAIFLLFNGYFILLSPAAYLHDILLVNNALMPSAPAPIGFFIFMNYTIPISAYFVLFALSAVAVVLLSLYFNNKKAIPVLGFVPLLFMSHALLSYYYLFIVMLVTVIYMKPQKQHEGILRSYIKRNASLGYVFAAILVALCAVGALFLIQSHTSYVNAADFGVSNQSAYYYNNTLYYNSTLTYNSAASVNNKSYILLNFYSFPNLEFYGLDNSSIINGTEGCAFPCSVNINVMHLDPSAHSYSIGIVEKNITYLPYESVLIYNGDYVYNSDPVEVGMK